MKIKKLITVFTIAAMSLLPTMSAGATGNSNGIVFDGNSQQFVTNLQGTGFTNLLPGEPQTVSFNVTNEEAQELRFYMSTDVVKNIAETGSGTAIYDFNIVRNNEATPFLEVIAGSTVENSAGLDLLMSNDKVLLDTLAKGESVEVAITLGLDGTTNNTYQNQTGNIQLQFSAETIDPAPTVTQTTTRTVTDSSGSSIKTGDENNIYLYMGLAVGAAVIMGSLLVALKKRNKKNKNNMMMIGVLVLGLGMLLPSNVASASGTQTYEVSFKAGLHGTIYGGGSHDALVAYGDPINLDNVAADVDAKDGYTFAGWSTEESGTVNVEEDMKLVAQYNRIVNEASYSVNYVDDFGNIILTQKVAMTELGTQIFENAPAIEGYTATVATQSAVISEKNGIEITFVYSTDPTIVTETTTVVVPGAAAAAATPAATPAAAAPAPAAPAATPATPVPDDQVPLDDGTPTDDNENPESVPDEETPLAEGTGQGTESNTLPIVLGVLAGVLVIGAGITVFVIKKRKVNL